MSNSQTLEHDWFSRPLPDNVVMGDRSWLHSSYAFLHFSSQRPSGVRIGENCGIYKGTFFNLGPDGEVEIGDYTTLVGAIISTNKRVVIESYVFVAHEVVLADASCSVPPLDAPAPELDATAVSPVSIYISENCWIGMRAILLEGAHLGRGAIVGAGAVVDFPVPDHAIVAGNPARVVGWAKP